MRLNRLKFSAVLLLGYGLTGLQAQESITSAGGNASGGAGTVSYSLGQVVYQTNIGTGGSVAEGVQQSYEVMVVTAIEETKSIYLSVSAYPNPANDFLTLTVENTELSNLHYQLYNMDGKLLQSGEITGNHAIIVIGNLVPSNYFVKVVQGGEEVKTFKIIKK